MDGVGDAGEGQVLRLARVMRVVRLFRGAHFQVRCPLPSLLPQLSLAFLLLPPCAPRFSNKSASSRKESAARQKTRAGSGAAEGQRT